MSENTKIARFRDKRTLTTEEWKAELELERKSVSCANASVPVNYQLYVRSRA